MTWLVTGQKSQSELSSQFRKLMCGERILKIPGVHDGMAGLVAKQVGFESLYLSGAAYTASRGLPDLGILHSEEVANRAKEIIRATNLPLLVDIDTGFGGVLNTVRTVAEMVEARVAAVQIEDQELPKKCGHLNGKKLVSTADMIQKIQAIKETAPSLVVVARTDAYAVEGIDAATKRMKAYVEAGADAVFPEAFTNKEEFQGVRDQVAVPLLANMTEFGKTPYYTAEEFESFGYSIVIYPVSSLRVAAKAYQNLFTTIYNDGTQVASLGEMQSREELYDLINLYQYEELDKKISKTILPNRVQENKNI